MDTANHINKIILTALSFSALIIFYIKFDSLQTIPELYKTDYPNYYFAGERFLSGEAIYKPIKDEVKALFGWDNYIAYTADTPLTVIVLSPLSMLPPESGAILLNLTSILLVSIAVFLLSKSSGINFLNSIFNTCLALSSVSFIFLVEKVHMESIVLFLAAIGFVALKKGLMKTCGLIWGFAAALKLFPLLWFLPFFFNKEKKEVLVYGLVTFWLASLMSLFLIGIENSLDFALLVLPMSQKWYGAVGNYSLVSFFTALCGHEYARYLALFTALLLLFFSVYFLKLGNFSDEKAYTLSTSLALLLSPLSWLNYFILIFPCLIWLSQKYSYFRLAYYYELLILIIVFWAWPAYIATPWYPLTIILSFIPMFALISMIFHYQKKL